ncbi:hypothetical protein [Massilia aquatica]|uniref:YopX protein domain-containing protein n=1 Tax=Massilia aquatica TaxID=2609000 RepID=A0ABX0MCH5_9BURK|nr:hypothetical protein [Massilia aquatica]NHZ44870.1 hypothetical protein [Massilia aquatica]
MTQSLDFIRNEQEIHMPIWETIPVTDQPTLTLERWSIYELPDGDRHLVGWAIENREGRVSSRIEQFDISTMCGVTSTGRVYKLDGRPGLNMDAEYTWNNWRAINDVESFVNVSQVVWAEHENELSN